MKETKSIERLLGRMSQGVAGAVRLKRDEFEMLMALGRTEAFEAQSRAVFENYRQGAGRARVPGASFVKTYTGMDGKEHSFTTEFRYRDTIDKQF